MHPDWTPKRTILEAGQLVRVVRRMANQIVEVQGGVDHLLLIGIRTRGVPLAEALAEEIGRTEGKKPPVGVLDINLYRDDLSTIAQQPEVRETALPPLDGAEIVLCDDVLFTGRTIRAALDALSDFGRPSSVRLAVLIDRGHRELPIQADVVGKKVPTSRDELVDVRFESVDGEDKVQILERKR